MIYISLIFLLGSLGVSIILSLNKSQKTAFAEREYSLLTACRNEEDNLETLINSINNLNYPKDKFEAIIVDDVSTDRSWEILQKLTHDVGNIHCLRLEEKSFEYKGKKAALKLAAENARFDYFLFTDADCRLDPEVLSSYNRLIKEDTGAVAGWYLTSNSGIMQRIIDIYTALSFALSIYLKNAFTASGMNWLVSREAFLKVGGYEKIKHNIASDDKLLLLLVKKEGFSISFNRQFPVHTVIDNTITDQRMRRKYGKFGSDPLVVKLLIILLGFYMGFVAIASIWGQYEITLLYFISMTIIWISSLIHFKLKFLFKELASFYIFPYYALYYTLVGGFGNWEWKGQKKK